MNKILWHIDSALLSMVRKPLFILGGIFTVLVIGIAICIKLATGESNDA